MRKSRICVFCETWESGGIEGLLTNLLLHMDRKAMEIDIVVSVLKKSIFTEGLLQAGVHFIQLSGQLYGLPSNYRLFRALLQEKRYDVVHVNAYQGMSLYYLKIAADMGVPVRIAHSHNTALRKSLLRPVKHRLHEIYKARYAQYATKYWACSRAAGEFLFPKQLVESACFELFPNGIEISRFQRNHVVRENIRSSLGIGKNQFVIGNVGRLCYQKNQSFLIDTFAEVKKQCDSSVLLLVGDGSDRDHLQQKVSHLDLKDSVIFYGTSQHVEELFWAMDLFVFPSRFEGFGIVILEAQAAGLRVVCSEMVPEEARFLPTTAVLSLQSGAKIWADQIMHLNGQSYIGQCFDVSDQIYAAGYDISTVASKLKKNYTVTAGAVR